MATPEFAKNWAMRQERWQDQQGRFVGYTKSARYLMPNSELATVLGHPEGCFAVRTGYDVAPYTTLPLSQEAYRQSGLPCGQDTNL